MSGARVSKAMVEKYGKPRHLKPRGYKYEGYAMAVKRDKGDVWGGGWSICLWCGHQHSHLQGLGLVPEYHNEGCPAWGVKI